MYFSNQKVIGNIMIKGSCLCEKIQFEANELPNMVFNCHCSRCRKAHGSAFATQIFAVKDSLKFIKGKDALTEYDSTGGIRTFCSACGSRLMNYGKEGTDYLSVAISAIDNADEFKPTADCFTKNKIGWVKLDDKVKSWDEFPEF